MNTWRRGPLTARLTTRGADDCEIQLEINSSKAVLSLSDFLNLYAWLEQEESRLAKGFWARMRKHRPGFAMGEMLAVNGEELNREVFGTKDIFVQVISLDPLKIEDPTGKVWKAGLGTALRKLPPSEMRRLKSA
jgi:hypothetical protein